MTLATSILEQAGESLGSFLPQLAGAVALLLVGLLVARLVGRLVRRALRAAGVDDLGARWRVSDTLARAGVSPSLAQVVGTAVTIVLSVIVVFAALTLLGLEPLSESLNEAVLFLPNVLVALTLMLAGVILAGLVRERVDRLTYQMDFPVPLGQLAQAATLALFAITAAAQVGVSAEVLTLVSRSCWRLWPQRLPSPLVSVAARWPARSTRVALSAPPSRSATPSVWATSAVRSS